MHAWLHALLAELCVLRTFGSPQIPLVFICPQSVPAFPWDRLGASIEFPVIPKRAQYAQFGCQYLILEFIEMSDRLYDVWARTHTLGGGGPKRLVTTCRVTYWEGTQQVWGVAKL